MRVTHTFMRFICNVPDILCTYFHEQPNRVMTVRDYRPGWISECYHDWLICFFRAARAPVPTSKSARKLPRGLYSTR